MRIWTEKALDVIRRAEEMAFDRKHAQLDPLHLLAAFLDETSTREMTVRIPDRDPALVAQAAEEELAKLPRVAEEGFATPNDALQDLLLRAADLVMVPPGKRREGLIGRGELFLALTVDSGRAGELLRGQAAAQGSV